MLKKLQLAFEWNSLPSKITGRHMRNERVPQRRTSIPLAGRSEKGLSKHCAPHIWTEKLMARAHTLPLRGQSKAPTPADHHSFAIVTPNE